MSSVVELDHSAFEMGIYGSQPQASIKPEMPGPEDSRIKVMAAGSPRVPKVMTFFDEIAKLATHTMATIRATWKGFENRVTSSLLYKTACKKSIESLALAFKSNDIKVIRKQFEKFCRFRNVQRSYLKEQDPEAAKSLEKTYHQNFKKFIEPFEGELNRCRKKVSEWERTTDIPRSERRDVTFNNAMVTLLLKYADAPIEQNSLI